MSESIRLAADRVDQFYTALHESLSLRSLDAAEACAEAHEQRMRSVTGQSCACSFLDGIPIVCADPLYQQKAAVLRAPICDKVWRSGRDLVALAD